MDVKEAVGRGRDYLGLVFSDEKIAEVRLEEVRYDRDERSWLVTFSMLRPGMHKPRHSFDKPSKFRPLEADYKVVKIPEDDREHPSIKIRETVDG